MYFSTFCMSLWVWVHSYMHEYFSIHIFIFVSLPLLLLLLLLLLFECYIYIGKIYISVYIFFCIFGFRFCCHFLLFFWFFTLRRVIWFYCTFIIYLASPPASLHEMLISFKVTGCHYFGWFFVFLCIFVYFIHIFFLFFVLVFLIMQSIFLMWCNLQDMHRKRVDFSFFFHGICNNFSKKVHIKHNNKRNFFSCYI